MSWRLVCVVGLAACGIAAGGCHDFQGAYEKCVESRHCAKGVPPDDAGSDGADGGDGGSSGDGGTLDAGMDGGTAECDGVHHVLAAPFCRGNWCWEAPLPHGNELLAAAASGETIWAAGTASTLMKIQDCVISQVEPPEGAFFNDMVAVGPNEVVVVGDPNYVFKHSVDGGVSRFYDFQDSSLRVTAIARHGGNGEVMVASGGPRVARVPIEGAPTSEDTHSTSQVPVAAAASNTAYWIAFGDGIVRSHPPGTNTFTAVLPPSEQTFRDVWVDATSDLVFAVGDDGALHVVQDESFAAFAPPSTFTVGSVIADLHTIAGTNQNQLWVAGSDGAAFEKLGSTWSQVARLPNGDQVTQFDYHAATVSASGRPWLVGEGGVLVTRSPAGEWMDIRTSLGSTKPITFKAVAAHGDERWAVSDDGHVAYSKSDAPWTLRQTSVGGFNAAIAVEPGKVVVGGDASVLGTVNTSGTYTSVPAIYDGNGTPLSGTFSIEDFAMASDDPTTIWALGSRSGSNLLLRWNGTQWSQVAVPGDDDWRSLAAPIATRVLLGGSNGTFGEVDVSGSPKTSATILTGDAAGLPMNAVVFVQGVGVFVGTEQRILKVSNWSAGSYTSKATPNASTIHDAVVTANEVLMVGTSGRTFSVDPASFTIYNESRASAVPLNSIVLEASGRATAVGVNGTILRRNP